jgi:hypothetical protein
MIEVEVYYQIVKEYKVYYIINRSSYSSAIPKKKHKNRINSNDP